MGRRVKKATYAYSAGDWAIESESLFVYDGWNLIEEIKIQNSITNSTYYVWGLDLSKTMQNAGGIGGLIASVDSVDAKMYLYTYEPNGNVAQVLDGDDGAVVASYEYDPFGNTTYQSGVKSDDNVFRFSTKYFDDVSGLYYYGYRYYSAELGRWIRKDPFQEYGGINIYVFGANNPINKIDLWGLLVQLSDTELNNFPWEPFSEKIPATPESPVILPDSELDNVPDGPPVRAQDMQINIGNCGSTVIQRVLIPDAPFSFDFSECCYDHDNCYGNCNKKQRTCDNEFKTCMLGKVEEQDRWYLPGTLGKISAKAFAAVVRAMGETAWRNAQIDNKCCPKP